MGPTWSLWTKVFGSYVGDPYGPHLGAHMGPMWDPVGRVDRVSTRQFYRSDNASFLSRLHFKYWSKVQQQHKIPFH